jgi:hypothetical protein
VVEVGHVHSPTTGADDADVGALAAEGVVEIEGAVEVEAVGDDVFAGGGQAEGLDDQVFPGRGALDEGDLVGRGVDELGEEGLGLIWSDRVNLRNL